MNDVGEPCEGKPHARFEAAAGGNAPTMPSPTGSLGGMSVARLPPTLQERNVLDHLPERDRPAVKRRLRRAWAQTDHRRALGELRLLASELERSHPGAAASLREGMQETLTLTRLGIRGTLKKTLESTNPCESMIECVRRSARNVKHWQSGDMCLRWTAAGMLEAERQFRRIIGYADLAKLVTAIERELDHTASPTPTEEPATLVTA
jgi:putative transposase